jgi:hypothetical protein
MKNHWLEKEETERKSNGLDFYDQKPKIMNRSRIQRWRKDAEVMEWDFAAAPGNTLKEKITELVELLQQFRFNYLIGGPESLALVEMQSGFEPTSAMRLVNEEGELIYPCGMWKEACLWKDVLYPQNELLLVGPDHKQRIQIRNI